MINLFFIEEAAGREVRRFCFMGIVAFVSFRGCKWIIYPLYIANTAPRMLRDTAGEKGYVRYKPVGEMSFSIPPSLRATSPMAAPHPAMLRSTAREKFKYVRNAF